MEIKKAEFELETAQLTAVVSEAEERLASHQVNRRRVVSPLVGVVVEVNRRSGEWVQPGQTVLRIVRMDRLRVEGFLPASQAHPELKGRPVELTVQLAADQVTVIPGTVVFVSPEIHPVNGKVSIWAEVDNPDAVLRPGLKARMSINAPAP